MTQHIQENLKTVLARIRQAARDCGRDPESIRLVAVGKTHGADAVEAAAKAGATIIGENYVQEAKDKMAALADLSVSWHMIGYLQANKAKYAVRMFDLIHSVDSQKLMAELNKRAKNLDKIQDILIQVNLAKEQTKAGVKGEDEALALARAAGSYDHIRVRGLMTIPPFFDDPEGARPFFRQVARLADDLKNQKFANCQMTELSMGMTGDFEAAIEEGATLVRVGTAIFGPRHYAK